MPSTRKRQPAKSAHRVSRTSRAIISGNPSAVVNVHEAKSQLSRLLARVEAGEEITIARAGHPLARLVPLAPAIPLASRVPGRFKGQFRIEDNAFFAPLPTKELADWETSELIPPAAKKPSA